MILNSSNKAEAKEVFSKILDIGIDFKLQKNVNKKQISDKAIEGFLSDLPEDSVMVEDVLKEFEENILPYCTNFSSKKFLGFPDSGNSVGAISGALLSDFLQ